MMKMDLKMIRWKIFLFYFFKFLLKEMKFWLAKPNVWFLFFTFLLYASLTECVFIQINENNFGFLDFITTIRYQPINRVMIDT